MGVIGEYNIPFVENKDEIPFSGEVIKLRANLTYTFDKEIARALCKISFNYFSYWNDVKYLISKNYDTLRNFIRYDEKLPDDSFQHDNNPILFNDPMGQQIVRLHY